MLINPKQPIIRQIKEGEYEYQADLYDAKVFFNDPQADDYNHLMKIVKSDKELIFKMLNASPTNITVDKDNQLTYHNVFEGVDTVYTLYPNKVKEDIIINSPEAEHVFKFRVYESLPATMQDSGDILYCDNDNDNQLFCLPAPYATDTNNNTVDVEMIYEEGYYTYKVIPNKNTVYPIILDPTVEVTIDYSIIKFSASKPETSKSDSKTFYFEDNIPKPKSMDFSTYILRILGWDSEYSVKINIIVCDKYNSTLEKIERTHNSTALSTDYHTIDIPDKAHHIYFYGSIKSYVERVPKDDKAILSYGIYSVTYNDEDNIFIQDHSGLSLTANTQQIYTFTNKSTLPTVDISKLSFFAEDPSCITIDSITINDQIVDKNNFSMKPNDKIEIALTSTKTQQVGYIAFVKKVVTQEYQLLNINENTIEAGNDQFNLKEYIANGGNSDIINTKELIYANESSELPIKINIDGILRKNIPVYTSEDDSSSVICHIFDSKLANYVKVLGFTVSSSESCSCFYTDYNDGKYYFSALSTKKTYISDNSGIKGFRSDPLDLSIDFRVFDVTVKKFDANLEPEFFTYDNIRTTFENEHVVKIVNGDIYEVINPKMGDVSSNLIPLGRDKILVRTGKTYYIKFKESIVVGVFRYVNAAIENSLLPMNEKIVDNNATIENSLLPMNEKISYGSNIKLIENICTTKKSEIQTMEYIIKGNEYQYINTKEVIYANEGSELLLMNENTIEADNNQFNLEERIINDGNSEINVKEKIVLDGQELLPMNENTIEVDNNQFNLEERIIDSGNPDINAKELIYANENSLLSMNEKILDNITIENSLLPMNEKICYESNVKLIENICTTKKSEIRTMEYIIKDNEYQYINTKENIYADKKTLLSLAEIVCINDIQSIPTKEIICITNEEVFDIKETISISSSDIFDINEKIYGIEKEKIPLIEKTASDVNSDLIDIKELVSISDNTVINIKENIQLARDLNIIEKVFAKDNILLPITEGITTDNDSLIRILENVKNSSEDKLDIKEYIATSIGEEKLDIIEKIPTSDKTVINIIENIMIDGYDCIPTEENIVINDNSKLDIIERICLVQNDNIDLIENIMINGYSCIPIKENIVINDNSKIDIIERICLTQNEDISLNENIVEKAAEEIVLLEEVKILGNDAVSIIENVKPVSLTIVENIRQEVDYATRLITFTKPTFSYKKGK